MIAIIVFIVFLNAIHCQNDSILCELMKTNGRYEGIQVFTSSVQKATLMYKNGYQWKIKIDKFGISMISNKSPIGNGIMNRFSGEGYDCEVIPQASFYGKIVTNCSDGNSDPDNYYDPKDVIFRASNRSDNNWVGIYNKKSGNISCYSPKEKKLVTDRKECKKLFGRNEIVIEAVDPLVVESIDSIVEITEGKIISGYYVFFRRDGRPVFCTKSMLITENKCKDDEYITKILADCFPPIQPKASTWKTGYTILIVIVGVIIIVVSFYAYVFFGRKHCPQILPKQLRPPLDTPSATTLQSFTTLKRDETSTEPSDTMTPKPSVKKPLIEVLKTPKALTKSPELSGRQSPSNAGPSGTPPTPSAGDKDRQPLTKTKSRVNLDVKREKVRDMLASVQTSLQPNTPHITQTGAQQPVPQPRVTHPKRSPKALSPTNPFLTKAQESSGRQLPSNVKSSTPPPVTIVIPNAAQTSAKGVAAQQRVSSPPKQSPRDPKTKSPDTKSPKEKK